MIHSNDYRVPTVELSYANKERHRYHNHALVLRLMTTELKTPKDIVQHEKKRQAHKLHAKDWEQFLRLAK